VKRAIQSKQETDGTIGTDLLTGAHAKRDLQETDGDAKKSMSALAELTVLVM